MQQSKPQHSNHSAFTDTKEQSRTHTRGPPSVEKNATRSHRCHHKKSHHIRKSTDGNQEETTKETPKAPTEEKRGRNMGKEPQPPGEGNTEMDSQNLKIAKLGRK